MYVEIYYYLRVGFNNFFSLIKLSISIESFPPICYGKEMFESSPESGLIPSWDI